MALGSEDADGAAQRETEDAPRSPSPPEGSPRRRLRRLRRGLSWTVVAPALAIVVLALTWGRELPAPVYALVAVVLGVAVLAAVHHAEVVAHRVGEPFGSLVLAIAVTVIEVALIVVIMVSGGAETASLARDTAFAAVMITTNGIVGISLLLGALRYHTTLFNAEGSGAALATVATLTVMTLVLPAFTTSEPGLEFSGPQLAFASIASIALYGMFVFTQTVRHRDFFLPVETETNGPMGPARSGAAEGAGAPGAEVEGADSPGEHSRPPDNRTAMLSLGLLVVTLVAVVGLAKVASPAIEAGVEAVGFPPSFVGVVIALLVLAPETLAAARAALRERIQISLNLAYGSAMATIGLTIPSIAIASIWLKGPLVLGLGSTQMVLLALTIVVSVLTVVPGRATRLQGGVHLVLLAAFVFLAINP